MTRFLSESLRAPEPVFGLNLRGLERAHGNPGADIKLTSAISLGVKEKISQLGFDHTDTTPKELYQALVERMKTDDRHLTRNLRTVAATHVSAEAEIVAGMTHVLKSSLSAKNCYALKPVVCKKIIKAQPPKKTLKLLGYRSLESMLKQEPLAAVLAAASMAETSTWNRNLHDRYKKLTAQDFEVRKLAVIHPESRRWRQLATDNVNQQKHNIMSFPELGAIVLLPLPATVPPGVVTASFALAIKAANDIHSRSTYMKLCQVRPDFGQIVRSVAVGEPMLQAHMLDRQVPWQLIQRFYARAQQYAHEELFEPHIAREDLSWHGIERAISKLEPRFAFWHDSAHLGLVHGKEVVSLNLIDTALNVCNGLQFDQRQASHFRDSLWHELQLRYLHPQTVEQTVIAELQPKLAYAPALA